MVLDSDGLHASSNCKTQKYPRHNVVQDTVRSLAKQSGESSGPGPILEGGIRGDLLLGSRAVPLIVDVTIRSPFVDNAAPLNEKGELDIFHHLNKAQKEKAKMYQDASYQENKMFRTFAVNSTGMWGSETKEVLGPMADSYAEGHFIPPLCCHCWNQAQPSGGSDEDHGTTHSPIF